MRNALAHNQGMKLRVNRASVRCVAVPRSASAKGFTLVELMIAVAVLAILAAIAYPSYVDSVRKSRRADAMGALMQVQTEQEKLRANCPQYAGSLTGSRACGADAAATSIGLSSATTLGGFYTLSLSNASATGYTATATATGSQSSDTACRTFTLTVSGLSVTSSAANSSSTDTSSTCWIK